MSLRQQNRSRSMKPHNITLKRDALYRGGFEGLFFSASVASLGKKKCGRVIITWNGAASAVLVSPEELETLEILADKKLMLSLLKAEEDERAQRLVTHEGIFK